MQACAVLWIVVLCCAVSCKAFLIRRLWNPDGTVEDLIDIPEQTRTDERLERDQLGILHDLESLNRKGNDNILDEINIPENRARFESYDSLLRFHNQGEAHIATKRGTEYSLNDLLSLLQEMYGNDEIYHVGRAHPMRFGAGKR